MLHTLRKTSNAQTTLHTLHTFSLYQRSFVNKTVRVIDFHDFRSISFLVACLCSEPWAPVGSLIVRRSLVDNRTCVLLAQALVNDASQLYSINLNTNDIGNAGAQMLMDALASNSKLAELNLSYNNLGRATKCGDVCGGLRRNTTLKTLTVSYNGITGAFMESLCDMIAENTGITDLQLAYNEITDEDMRFLSAALLRNTSVTKLGLAGNKIADAGAIYLAEVLKRNDTLVSVSLRNNFITDVGLEALADGLKTNADTFREIHVEDALSKQFPCEPQENLDAHDGYVKLMSALRELKETTHWGSIALAVVNMRLFPDTQTLSKDIAPLIMRYV
jgi:hypothetical protein